VVNRVLLRVTLAGALAGSLPSHVPVAAGDAQAAQTRPGAAAAVQRSLLPNDKDSVKFLVIGDSGTGGREQ